MRTHFLWHKITECHCVKSYSNQIIIRIIKKLWHCLSVPSSLIKRSNLIWKHVALLMSGPISLDLSNVCGPDAEFGCSLHWSCNPPFEIPEVLEVEAVGVFISFICFRLKAAARLHLIIGLLYLVGKDELWKKDCPPQKQWNFKNEMWEIKCSWKLKPWTLAPLTWVLGMVDPLLSSACPGMCQEHRTVARGSHCAYNSCPVLPQCRSHSPAPPMLNHRAGMGDVKLSHVLFTYIPA